MPAIITNNLTRSFGKRLAVNRLNLEIEHGEIFSLLGTNGAGKTTTIKMLCCLLKPSAGSATVVGNNIYDHPLEIKKNIGVSPQETAIAGHLSIRENLMLMGGVSGLRRDKARKRAIELMALLEIEDRKDQARRLSGGLQRRLSIAMALMPDPKILFLDEPTLGLDPHARRSVWKYIEKLKGNKTILLTTHYLEEADSLADNIAIMDHGVIVGIGTPAELKRKHSTKQCLSITSKDISEKLLERLNQDKLEIELVKQGIEIRSDKLDFYAIVDILRRENILIEGIQLKEPSLDDVFLNLTGKEELL